MFKRRSLRARWMLNGIVIILTFVLISVAAFSLAMSSYYYTSVRTGLEAKAKTASEVFTTYISRTYADYQRMAYRYTETFDDKDKLELQFINTRGRIEVSSFGLNAGTSPGTPDIAEAIELRAISSWTGERVDTGERVLSVSSPMLYGGQVVGVMRYVTSLRLVDKLVAWYIIVAAAVGSLVTIVVVLSNLFFIRTITEPIRELTAAAKSIADGGYGTQTAKKFDDEIGELTDALNEMSTKIKQADRIQTEFISQVSHELRTPLTAITGWSETLLFDETVRGENRRGLTIISREAARLTNMVEELLEFTQIQDGRFTLYCAPMDVVAELRDAISDYSGYLVGGDAFEVQYIPPDTEIPMIEGDKARLRQVFLNILDNAAKHGRDGKRAVVTAELEGEFVNIATRDFGPGIPVEELAHVRKIFYKGNAKARGSGIGLAVCDEIVTRHRGSLEIQNAETGGLIVSVRLPIYDVDNRGLI